MHETLEKLHRRGLVGGGLVLAAGRGRAAADASGTAKTVAGLKAANEYRKRVATIAGDKPTRRGLFGALGLAAMGKGDMDERLAKAWAAHKHPREHDGKFASKTGETVGRFGAGAAGVLGGAYLGHKHGADTASKLGRRVGAIYGNLRHGSGIKGIPSMAAEAAEMKGGRIGRHLGGRYGMAATGAALGGAGYLAGGAAGRKVDEMGRRRRAIAAGRLDVYERLNAEAPAMTRKDVKAAMRDAKQKAKKTQRAYEFMQGLASL